MFYLIKKYKQFACWIGWHSYPNYDNTHYDPKDPLHFLVHAKCRWCNFEGLIDSQGNLF